MKRWPHKHLKLSHRRHNWRLRSHSHTSHGVLLVLLLAVGAVLVWAAKTENSINATLANEITVFGTVPGPPPDTPPVIDQPKPGDTFDRSPIDLTGRRPGDNIIEIYNNGIFGGAGGCADGTFSAKVGLITGNNQLKARQIDSLGQTGPFSEPFVIGYLPKLAVEAPVSQFYLVPSAAYFGRSVGQPYDLQAALFGGSPPYAVKISWGDGADGLLSLAGAGPFEKSHAYRQPGCYIVHIEATDGPGNEAYAQTVVLISGSRQPQQGAFSFLTGSTLDLIWPLFIVAFGGLTLFWLGERYELEKIKDSLKFRKKR